MFMAFAPEMLDDWLRRANREAAASGVAKDRRLSVSRCARGSITLARQQWDPTPCLCWAHCSEPYNNPKLQRSTPLLT